MTSPKDLGFFMPAEWTPHKRCWMAWPCREERWGDSLDAARDCVAEIAKTVAEFEPVSMLSNPADVAEVSLRCGSHVSILPMLREDCLVRDIGPSFLVDGKGGRAGVDWVFDGWSDSVDGYDHDAELAATLLDHLELTRFTPDVILEPGAYHLDGQGTLVATERSIAGRNAGMSRAQIEAVMGDYLGISKVLWLPKGLLGDSRDEPVENVARFAAPGVILAPACHDPDDPNFENLQQNLRLLEGATDAKGQTLNVVEMPLPHFRKASDGRRLGLSYLNFYIANGGVVMPAFEDSQDQAAYEVLKDCFPDREVVQVSVVDIMEGAGIHGITLQEPA